MNCMAIGANYICAWCVWFSALHFTLQFDLNAFPLEIALAPLPTGGALGALFVGLVASNAWEKGVPRFGSLGRSFVFSPESE